MRFRCYRRREEIGRLEDGERGAGRSGGAAERVDAKRQDTRELAQDARWITP